MDLKELLTLAFQDLPRYRTRSVLTILGIVIGVASVIVMVGIGEGSRKATEALIRNMGTNVIMILPGSASRFGPVGLGAVRTLTEGDAEAIRRELPDCVSAATPAVHTHRPAVYQNANWLAGQVLGVGPDYLLINPWALERGRYFDDREVRSMAKVCVLGKTVEENLFAPGEDPVGKTIRVGGLPFQVIGVLSRKGGGVHGDQDDTVHAPYTTVMHKLMGRDYIQAIATSAVSEERVNQADAEISALLRQRHRLRPGEDDDFAIRRQNDWIEASAKQSAVLTLLLTLAAAISLIVGGVGISNIMLVTVTERTHEIGLRRAVGATRGGVLIQFLSEAIILALFGGLLGLGLSLACLSLLERLSVPALVVGWGIAMGLGSAFFVGVAAGFFPALKAARIDVIDALRYE